MLVFPLLGFSQITENFEGATFPPTTDGLWLVGDNGVGTGISWTETNNPTLTFGGVGKSGYMNRESLGGTATSQDWLITPRFTVPVNGQLKFYTRQTLIGDNGTSYQIRVSTDPSQANQAAYNTIQTWTETTLNTTFNIYEEKLVSLNANAGQQVYVAFVKVYAQTGPNSGTTGGDRWLIDDVKVTAQCLNPSILNVLTVNPTTAQLTWANNGSATSWQVEVIPVAAAPTGVGVTAPTNPFTIGGLTPGTAYKYYVRSDCGGGNFSQWVGPFNFITTPFGSICSAPITITALPYSNTSNTNLYGDEVDVIQGASCGATPAATNYLQGAEVFYSYTATATGNISVTMNPTGVSSSIFIYNGCASFPATCIAGVANTNGNPRTLPLVPVVAGNTYIFVISSSTTPVAGIPYTLIIQDVNCAQPATLTATNISTTSADFSWSNPSGATSWQVAVQPAGSGIPTGPGVTTGINTNSPAPGVLTAATAYQYWVRADCGGGLFSAWSGPFLFNTSICAPAQQCTYIFRTNDSFGDGWNGNTMSVRQNGVTVATITGPTDPDNLTFINFPVTLCENFPFELFWNAGGTFAGEVGISVINNYAQTIYNKPPGTGAQNTLLYSGAFDCDAPACLPPTALTATAITATTATLGWTGGTSWNVYVVAAGNPAPTSTTVPTYAGVTTNTLPIVGLTPGTAYQFYVSTICSPTSTSNWSSLGNFVTSPGCGGGFFDNGGPTASYTVSADNTVTICPINPGDQVTVTFTSFDTESTYDGLYVFNGNSIAAPQIASANGAGNVPGGLAGSFWGTAIPGPFTSTAANGCLTFRFRSDTSVENAGWVANVTCAPPPTCTKPTTLTATAITQTSATLGWIQPANPNGSFPSTWEVLVLPCGSPAPIATTTGFVTATTNPFNITGLTPNTCYDYYVRAFCSATDTSLWGGPRTFNTLIINDECSGAIQAPINQNTNCLQTVNGSIGGATASPQTNTCGGAIDDDDAWFYFVASDTRHYISLLDVTPASTLNYAIYTGNNCGSLTQVGGCITANGSVANGLIIGQRYYVRVYSPGTAPISSTFRLCIGSKVITCPTASQLCALNPIILPNNVGVPSNPNPISGGAATNVGCLGGAPSPTFYYLTIPISGNYTFFMEQNANNTFTGAGLDIDYASWGPFASNAVACAALTTGNVRPAPTGCSFSINPTETVTINGAIAGQVYVLMITNWTANTLPGRTGFIRITQTAGPVPTSCCPYTNFTYSSSFYCKTGANPTPTIFAGASNGTYTSTAGLVINPITGQIDLAASTAGTYIVSNTIAGNPSCPTSTSSWSITITDPPVATIAYSTSPFCRSIITPQTVTQTGTAGGNYSASPAGLNINTLTGAINPSLSTAGTYTVSYTIFATAGCPNIVNTTSVTVTTAQVANFIYNSATYCQNGVNPVLTYTGGGSAGVFTSTTGLSLNASNGAINLATSTPGLYTITNTIVATGGCPASISTFNITITAPPIATFSYLATPYCSNAVNPNPVYSGGGVAGIYSATPSGLVFVSTSTGEINITGSTPGTYTVQNLIVGTGGCGDVIATSTVTITLLPTATILYNPAEFCYDGSLESVQLTANSTGTGGTFTASPAGLSINASSGQINPSLSTAGSYTVTYTVAAGAGCNAVSSTTPVVIKAQAAITFEEDCVGAQFELKAVVSNAGTNTVTYTWSGDGISSTNQNNNPIQLTEPGVYTLNVNVQGCNTNQTHTVASTFCVFPQGVSPNNDGKNDELDLTGLGVKNLEIFNRYGTLVYNKANYTKEWKGQANSGTELPVGTYYYLVNLKSGETKSGWIYINR